MTVAKTSLKTQSDSVDRNYNEAEAIFKRHSPDIVIHLAARVGGLFANQAQPVDFLTDNLAIDSNILRLCHEFKVSLLRYSHLSLRSKSRLKY